MIAGAGLATDGERCFLMVAIGVLDAPRRAAIDHAQQGAPGYCGHFGRHDPLAACRLMLQAGFERRVGCEAQLVDTHRRAADAVIDHDAHQFGQRRRAVGRTADRGGQRRHQMLERVAQAPPFLGDALEGGDLDHDVDAHLLGMLEARGEQPLRCIAAGIDAGRHDVLQRGLGFVLQMADQPQFQRMHAGQVALVGQAVLAGGMGVEQLAQAGIGAGFLTQLLAHEGEEAGEITLRQHAQVGGGLRLRAAGHRIAKYVEAIFRRHVAILVPVGAQETQALALGKAVEEGLAGFVVVLVAQSLGRRVGCLVGMVMHDVVHDADEGQVDRLFQRFGHARVLAVVLVLEVAEAVDAAASEEGVVRVGRVAALHGRLEQFLQRRFRLGAQDVDGPVAQAVGRVAGQLGQFVGRLCGVTLVQVGNDQQVGNQGAELGAGAEIELGAGIDVERLVEVVGLDTQDVGIRRPLVERQAVIDLLRIALGQQAAFLEAGTGQEGRIGQAVEDARHGLLAGAVEGGVHGQVVAVEGVEVLDAEQFAERAANVVDRLAFDEGHLLTRPRLTGRVDGRLERRFAQVGGNQLVFGEQADVAVGQRVEAAGGVAEQAGRAALGDEQRQRLLEGQRAFGQLGLGVGQQLIDRGEVPAIPGPQAIAQAVDFAVAGNAAERHRIDEIEHDAAARRQGFLAILVGAQGGRHHLVELVVGIVCAAAGGVAELLDLGRQRAAASAPATAQVDLAQGLAEGDPGQAAPVDRRVVFGMRGVEQVAVFDEEQRLDQHGRNGLEAGVLQAGILAVVKGMVVAVENAQAGLRFFAINREKALADNIAETLRLPGLGRDTESRRGHARQEIPELRVTEALLVGAAARQPDARVCAGFELPGRGSGLLVKILGLEIRFLQLDPGHRAGSTGQGEKGQREIELPAAGPGLVVGGVTGHRWGRASVGFYVFRVSIAWR